MRFSQRIGKKPVTKAIQLESMDDELRIGLWNLIKLYYLDLIEKGGYRKSGDFRMFTKITWHKFYRLPIDEISGHDSENEKYIRQRFFNGEWDEVYDFIEFLIATDFLKHSGHFIPLLNKLLESEFSGYRIIDGLIVPISNKIESKELEDAIANTNQITDLSGANIHLNNALVLISDRKNPDYRNSIKESISAVEATCRIITDENTLGKALSKLEAKGISINKQLKSGFEQIYAYTNDKKSGIRHAIVEQPNEPDFNDAKYMLVSCSAFVNYMIGKVK